MHVRCEMSVGENSDAKPGHIGIQSPFVFDIPRTWRHDAPLGMASNHGIKQIQVVQHTASYRTHDIKARAKGTTPRASTSPCVGRRPTTPHIADGSNTDPLVSVPRLPGSTPAATDAAEPLLDPDVVRSGFQGFLTYPKLGVA